MPWAHEQQASVVLAGLTVLAAGTALPKLLTTVGPAIRGQTTLAVGYTLTAASFELLGALGVVALIHPAHGLAHDRGMGLYVLAVVLAILLPLLAMRWRLTRPRALLLLLVIWLSCLSCLAAGLADAARSWIEMDFLLDPRLQADTVFVADWPLSRVLLMDDARFAWLVLVLRRGQRVVRPCRGRSCGADRGNHLRRGLKRLTGCAKINIGALGNLVPQLHVHVVARNPGDDAWPGPVWGSGRPVPYAAETRAAFLSRLVNVL